MIKDNVIEMFNGLDDILDKINDSSICEKTYDEIKETELIKEYVPMWVGLTYGLEGEDEERLALAYSQLTAYIMTADENELDGISQLQNTGFILYPLTRRVLRSENVNFNFNKYVNSLKHICMDDVFRKVEDKMMNGMGGYCDIEATASIIIANALILFMTGKDDDYVKEFINNEIDGL